MNRWTSHGPLNTRGSRKAHTPVLRLCRASHRLSLRVHVNGYSPRQCPCMPSHPSYPTAEPSPPVLPELLSTFPHGLKTENRTHRGRLRGRERASHPASQTRTFNSPCLRAPSLTAAPCCVTLGKSDNLSELVLLHLQTGVMPWRLAVEGC